MLQVSWLGGGNKDEGKARDWRLDSRVSPRPPYSRGHRVQSTNSARHYIHLQQVSTFGSIASHHILSL